MRLNNHECYRTGDINFFSACLSVGIPPLPGTAEVMAVSNGRDYHQFRLSTISLCGSHRTVDLDKAWNDYDAFQRERPDHPFAGLMSLIRHCINNGARNKGQWVEASAEFLGVPKDVIAKGVRDTRQMEENAPESPVTYACCLICNRFAAIDLAKGATPKEVLYEANDGPGILWMDGNLDKKQKAYLMRQL